MTAQLSWHASWESPFEGDPLEASTFASLRVTLGDDTLTALVDHAAQSTKDAVRVSIYPLAMWLACNWWRLRWESKAPRPDWRQTHALAAAGHGYMWPDVTFSSLGEFIEVEARPTRGPAWEPVRFLSQARRFVRADDFVASAADLIEMVLARLDATGHGNSPLSQIWKDIQSEQRNPDRRRACRFEAMLGYDPDTSPDGQLDATLAAATELGTEAVAEWASAQLPSAGPPDWRAIADDLRAATPATIDDSIRLQRTARRATTGLPYPWQRGEAAAVAVRAAMGCSDGPLSSKALCDWLRIESMQQVAVGAAYTAGHRDHEQVDVVRVRLTGHHEVSRRFKASRLIADHLVSAAAGDRLLPATRARTSRQSLQRAFAAEFLLPWSALDARVDGEPDDDDMDAIAEEYGVSPLVVRKRLVDKGRLDRDSLLVR